MVKLATEFSPLGSAAIIPGGLPILLAGSCHFYPVRPLSTVQLSSATRLELRDFPGIWLKYGLSS